MQILFEADPHNFGQTVVPVERAYGTWYRKPRSVFWEKMLFGKDSPLEQVFNGTGENGHQPLGNFLFNLEVETINPWLGFSRGVQSVHCSISDSHFYGFGVLIAYCYAFGVRDLHRYNLVQTQSHFQVVDAEVVMTKLILPNETLLLPFKDVSFELSGAGLLWKNLEGIAAADAERILAGYFDMFKSICDNVQAIKVIVDSQETSAEPIRMIVRNTGVYKSALEQGDFSKFLPEEKEQLNRGDIPYFFKLLGRQELFWIRDQGCEPAIVSDTAETGPDVDRHAHLPSELFPSESAMEIKMIQGSMLLQKLLRIAEPFKFRWRGATLDVGATELRNGATGRRFNRMVANSR